MLIFGWSSVVFLGSMCNFCLKWVWWVVLDFVWPIIHLTLPEGQSQKFTKKVCTGQDRAQTAFNPVSFSLWQQFVSKQIANNLNTYRDGTAPMPFLFCHYDLLQSDDVLFQQSISKNVFMRWRQSSGQKTIVRVAFVQRLQWTWRSSTYLAFPQSRKPHFLFRQTMIFLFLRLPQPWMPQELDTQWTLWIWVFKPSYLVLILVLTPFIIWYKQHVSFFLKFIFISSYLIVYLINIMHMWQPWSGHGSGVLLLRKRSHILAIHNLRLSLGLTLTRETDLRGPERNLTRRPFPLTWPLESFKPWQGEPLALGGLPPAPHLHPNTLPPITSQHPPTIWKDKSMQSDICLNSIHKTTCSIGKLSTYKYCHREIWLPRQDIVMLDWQDAKTHPVLKPSVEQVCLGRQASWHGRTEKTGR